MVGGNIIDLTEDATDDSEASLTSPSSQFLTRLLRSPTEAAGIFLPRLDSLPVRSSPSVSLSHRTAIARAPVSPPPLRRPSSITFSQPQTPIVLPAQAIAPAPAPRAPLFAATTNPVADNARDMARLSGVVVSTGSQQVTPPLELQPSKARQPAKDATPKDATPRAEIPLAETPRKLHWDVRRIADSLNIFRQDIKDGHAQLATYIIDSTEATERRVHSGTDLFAGLSTKPLQDAADETMRVKFKQHRQHSRVKKDGREERHRVLCIQTDEERVPRYRFHHVEIKKNMLTPNTMLTFVPHLRDLESSEETKYNHWLQELEDIDRKSGFKPMSREDKVSLTVRSEYAATVSLYLEDWLDRLAIPGCNKSTLIRYMARREPDDAITPRQKTDILNSHREADTATSSEANRAAEMFTEAFHLVFHKDQPHLKQIELRDVLLLDESVDSIMDSKPTAKDGSNSQNENEDDLAEYNLGTYCILGCLICYSHSCEHGEYDAQNCKRAFSIMSRLSDTLKRRRRVPVDGDGGGLANGHLTPSSPSNPCKRSCYLEFNYPTTRPPWSEDEHIVLRSMVITADRSKVKRDPLCLVADFLDRDCCDVYQEYELLHLSLPQSEPTSRPQIRTVSWFDRFKKTLIGDWQDHTLSHEHQRRELFEPCAHSGPCTLDSCTCVQQGLLCEKFCGCSVETCAYKFTGCACHSQGKTCFSKQKDRPCICVQLNRECDPELCGTCGAFERADPEHAGDEALHSVGCQNCALQRGEAKALLLGQSQLEGVGYGLYTAQDIPQDDFIIEYVGELISHDEGVRREARRGDEESSISYVFTLLENEGIWVDAAIYGNLSRYINHASESDKRGCNITPRILYVNGEYRIKFSAMRDIEAGEELFFNYGENFPNLTKKLLDTKAGGKPGQAKKRGRRPNTAASTAGVARKAPKAEKKKSGKAKVIPQAVPLGVEDEEVAILDGSNLEMLKPTRKRKRGMRDDSEEEEYHPTGTDATGSYDESQSPGTIDSDEPLTKSGSRLRRRTRQKAPKSEASELVGHARGEPKTRGKRGGARPGSGRPRKYPRMTVLKPPPDSGVSTAPAPAPEPLTTTVVAKVSGVSLELGSVAVSTPQPLQMPRGIADEIEDSEDAADDSMQRHIGDEYEDEEDEDVMIRRRLDRNTRNRRLPAKFREEEQWGGSQ
ncbi:hypothetical protein AK830_g9206 [Neonectria ditissima]|uniref:Histone-lysine N-methyltransferase EZH2 n=1 Tax=Neonectria ditissima TaxID=78410 RepID=A0A0P7AS81_9HYPO|nr:hypothetical protein AK830_g9206 [Neonectria ditissima]